MAVNREGEIQEREVVAAVSRAEGTQEWVTQAPLGFPGPQGPQGPQVPQVPQVPLDLLPADQPIETNSSPYPTSFPPSL